MKIVIFAGGSGKRLWPLSRENTPKQFQKLFGEETTLENSFNSISKKFKVEDIFISTGKDFKEQIFKTIPNLPKENLIIEPMIRDTAPAVAYAMLRIAQRFPDEAVVIRWQNSLIKDSNAFINALDEADLIFKNNEAKLVYLAVPSRYPNTGVGHIKIGNKIRDLDKAIGLYNFDGFVEKPNKELAEKYHNEKVYAWNPGCYITTPRYILDSLKDKSPELYEKIENIKNSFGKENEWETIINEFTTMEKRSIDYILWEKLSGNEIKIVVAEYGWHYVATWSDLKHALENNIEENVIKGNVKILDSKNCLVYNYNQNKIISVIGLEGIEVIDTGDALLVVNQNYTAKVKDLVTEMENNPDLKKYL